MNFNFLIYIIVSLLFTSNAFACSCSSLETTSNKYQQADFVGMVKILKTYKNDIDTVDRYRVDVKTETLLKGKAITNLITEGFNEVPNRWSSCGVGFTVGNSYLLYGNKIDGKIYVFYCGVTRYSFDKELKIINKIKPHVGGFTINTKYGRTTYLPSQYYLRFLPDSSAHLSLISVTIDKIKNVIAIKHLTDDDEGLKFLMKDVLTNKIDWIKKLEDKDYPLNNYTFIFELHPYTNSTYLREKGYLKN